MTRWNWLRMSRWYWSRATKRATTVRRRSGRLTLEMLEGRVLPSTITWINSAGGDWDVPGNWSDGTTHRLPGPNDDAVINMTGITVTHRSSNDSVKSITSKASLWLSGGTLNVTGNVQVDNPAIFTLAGGTLSGATVLIGTTLKGTAYGDYDGYGGTLSGVTLNADLDLAGPRNGNVPVNVEVANGLTLNGTISIGKADGSTYGHLYFTNTQTIAGNGSILLGGDPNNLMTSYYNNTAIVTLGPGLTVHGKSGSIGFGDSGSALINRGTINADGGGTITVARTWTNGGTFKAQGGVLFCQSTPTNFSAGTLTGGTWQVFADSTLQVNLGSGISTDAATILLDGVNSNFNSGSADALANVVTIANAGSFVIRNGRNFTKTGDLANNGTLTVGAGSTLAITGNYTQDPREATLEVQIGGPSALVQFGQLKISGSATLAGTLRIADVGGYGPTQEDHYQIMTYGRSSGQFASTTGLYAGRTQLFDVVVTDTDIHANTLVNAADLAVTNIPPFRPTASPGRRLRSATP